MQKKLLIDKLNYQVLISVLLATLLGVGLFGLAQANRMGSRGDSLTPLFSSNGTLTAGQVVRPPYINAGTAQQINFSLEVTGTASIQLTISNSGGTIWTGNAMPGETIWGTSVAVNGTTRLELMNLGGGTASFNLNLYGIPATPYTLTGVSSPTGLNSHARVYFPQTGLYTFDFDVNTGERFDFSINGDYIYQNIEGMRSATYFVPAGTHDIQIMQDATGGFVDWSVGMVYTSETSDSLPYVKNGSNIVEEYFPIYLESPLETNLMFMAGGDPATGIDIEITNLAMTMTYGMPHTIHSGETFWATYDLPAGISLVHLTSVGGWANYNLSLGELEPTDFTWTGISNAMGENSHARVMFDFDGLYQFDYTVDAGSYQFGLNVAGETHLQKIVEGNTSVIQYVPAGTHDVMVMQNTGTGAAWGVDIGLLATNNNDLPYARTGVNLGGVGNDFDAEWLPISLAQDTSVNLGLEVMGDNSDFLMVEVYPAGSGVPSHTFTQVLGGEHTWTNFDLLAGINYLHIMADGGNSNRLDYALIVDQVPDATMISWDGISLDAGLNSAYMIEFPATGWYHFDINNTSGFANLVLDDAITRSRGGGSMTDYEMMVTAGMHEVYVMQDVAMPLTEWTASINSIDASESFFGFSGTLNPGDTLTPQYTTDEMLDFNFSFEVAGGDVDLDITDGTGSLVWSDTGLDGEMLWGTGTLTGTNHLQLTNMGADPVFVNLNLYYLPVVDYDWSGFANASGVNSHIRAVFPSDTLYTFDYDNNGMGRFQFMVGSSHIQKSVEMSGTVSYFVPAGTHDLVIDQDSGVDTDWHLSIMETATTTDGLPYHKEGGFLGGPGNDFDTEWLPLDLLIPLNLNMNIQVAGMDGDHMMVEVIDSMGATVATFPVYANESHWETFDLPLNTNHIKLMADAGNAGNLSYNLMIDRPTTPDYLWEGTADMMGDNSHIRLEFAESGLYTLNYAASSGRFQFDFNGDHIKKTVEGIGSVTYYVPAGLHNLTINHDDTTGADWALFIGGPSGDNNILPYTKVGGELGGIGNEFNEEWLPITLGADTPVNIALTLTGDDTDSLRLEVWNAVSMTASIDPVYGTEWTWTTAELPAGSRLHVVTDGGNTNPLNYEIEIKRIPLISYVWEGHSLVAGTNATIRQEAPVDGTYLVEVYMPEGFTTLSIDGIRSADRVVSGFSYEFEVDLLEGMHTFTSMQDAGFTATSWTVTTTLIATTAPAITSITPENTTVGTGVTMSIFGINLVPTPEVKLVFLDDEYPLPDVTWIADTEIQVVVPNTIPVGTYDVVVINPGTPEPLTIEDGFTVFSNPAATGIFPNFGFIHFANDVEITGFGFLPGVAGTRVILKNGADEYSLINVSVVSETLIQATVTGSVPMGLYDVIVINPDGERTTIFDGYLVTSDFIYVPFVVGGN